MQENNSNKQILTREIENIIKLIKIEFQNVKLSNYLDEIQRINLLIEQNIDQLEDNFTKKIINLEKKIQILLNDNAHLRDSLNSHLEIAHEHSSLSELMLTLKNYQEENKSLNIKNIDLERQYMEFCEKHIMNEDSKEELIDLRQMNNSLYFELIEVKKNYESKKSELDELKIQFTNCELNKINLFNSNNQHQNIILDLQDKIEILLAENEKLKTCYEKINEKNNQNEIQINQITEFKKTINILQNENNFLQIVINKQKNINENLLGEIKEKETKINDFNIILDEKENLIENIKQENNYLENEIKKKLDFEKDQKNNFFKKNDFNSKLMNLIIINNSLNNVLELTSKEINKNKLSLDVLINENNKLNNIVQDFYNQNNSLKKNNKSLLEKIEILIQNNEKLNRKFDSKQYFPNNILNTKSSIQEFENYSSFNQNYTNNFNKNKSNDTRYFVRKYISP